MNARARDLLKTPERRLRPFVLVLVLVSACAVGRVRYDEIVGVAVGNGRMQAHCPPTPAACECAISDRTMRTSIVDVILPAISPTATPAPTPTPEIACEGLCLEGGFISSTFGGFLTSLVAYAAAAYAGH